MNTLAWTPDGRALHAWLPAWPTTEPVTLLDVSVSATDPAVPVSAPCDMLLFCAQGGDADTLACLDRWERSMACPVVVVTPEATPDAVAQWMASGASGVMWPDSPAPAIAQQLAVAQQVHARTQQLRKALSGLETRWADRVAVDKAKGILMHAQQLSDQEAYGLLRSTSMNLNQRLGQLATRVVESAKVAEWVNRCGQLRMLSQRLAKLAMLHLTDAGAWPQADEVARQTTDRARANLDWLTQQLDDTPYAAGLATVDARWRTALRAFGGLAKPQGGARAPGVAQRVIQVDDGLQAALDAADALVAQLQADHGETQMGWLNMVGRQRMLCQQLAKLTVARHAYQTTPALCGPLDEAVVQVRTAFEQVQAQLNALPLGSESIRGALMQVDADWADLIGAGRELTRQAPGAGSSDALVRVMVASEAVLRSCDHVAMQYETSLAVLLGAS